MVQIALEEKENVYCVNSEGIILESLLISEKKTDLACCNEDDSHKVNNVNNYAKYHEEFIPINIMKRNFAFRNHGVF